MRLVLAFSSWLLFHQAGYYFHRAGYYFTNLVTIYEAGSCFLNLVYGWCIFTLGWCLFIRGAVFLIRVLDHIWLSMR